MKSLCTIKHHVMNIWGVGWRYSCAHSSPVYWMVSGPASRRDRLNTVDGAPGISSDRRLDGPNSLSERTRVNRLSRIWGGGWRYNSSHSSPVYWEVSGPASRPDRLNTVDGAPGISSDRRLDGPNSLSERTRVNRLSRSYTKQYTEYFAHLLT